MKTMAKKHTTKEGKELVLNSVHMLKNINTFKSMHITEITARLDNYEMV